MSNEIEFVNDEPTQTHTVRQRIPADYIPVKLSSMGRLNAPAILHVRDYSGKDALELSLATQNSNVFFRRLVDVLNNVVFEGFDCAYLHEFELEEILLNITGNFITPTLQGYPYPYTDEEYNSMDDDRKKRIIKGQESLTVDIPIGSIKTVPISADFFEPISITNKAGLEIQFRLPRINDYFVAEDYVEKKYAEQEQNFSYVEKIFAIVNEEERDLKIAAIARETLRDYQKYVSDRGLDYIAAKQSQLIVKYGPKVLDDPEEKIKLYSEISMMYWKEYNRTCDNQLKFGVEHDVKMISPITKEEVTRRCQFRPMDYLSPDDTPNSGEYVVHFGN